LPGIPFYWNATCRPAHFLQNMHHSSLDSPCDNGHAALLRTGPYGKINDSRPVQEPSKNLHVPGFDVLGRCWSGQDPAFIASVMDTNAFGTLRVTQAVAPDMMRRHAGVIINIGSISSRFTTCFAGAYCASKAAQRSYTDALRIELLPFGIHVVWVHAGAIRTHFSTTASKVGLVVNRTKVQPSCSLLHDASSLTWWTPSCPPS
jgi:NAD(P)-dependent dehydrogenase (short-subunit alcohol dehydrogenase family)